MSDLNRAGVDAAALLDQYDSLAHDMIGALANAHAWALLAKDEPAAENQGEVMDALIWRWDALKKPKFDAVATLRSASPPQPEGETEELVPTAWQVRFRGDVRWVLNYYRPSDGEIEARPLYSADAITSLSQRLAVAEDELKRVNGGFNIATRFNERHIADIEAQLAAMEAERDEATKNGLLLVYLHPREDGGISVSSPDMPGLILSGSDPDAIMAAIPNAVAALRSTGGE